jgi:serine phosphatase RsbU (regulator of sigma subunit)
LYIYTDGLSESVDPARRELGVAGLQRLIDAASGTAPAARLREIVRLWRAAGYRCNDDVTLLVIEGRADG